MTTPTDKELRALSAINEAFERGDYAAAQLLTRKKVLGLLDRIAGLESERDSWGKLTEEFKNMSAESIGRATNFMNEIKALRSQLEEAKAALKPFGHIAEHIPPLTSGDKLFLQDYTGREHRKDDFRDTILIGHLRRAAALGETE